MEPSGPSSALRLIRQYILDFGVLRENRPAYWALQVVNVLESVAFFSFMNVATVLLTETLGWDDVATGWIYGAFTLLVTVSLFVTGFVTDALGIRRTAILALCLLLVSRGGIALVALWPSVPGRAWLAIPLLLVGSPGLAMVQTLYQAANRRFSTERSRGASFNVWYLLMNLGAVGAGWLIDGVHRSLGLDWAWVVAAGGAITLVSLAVCIRAIRGPDSGALTRTAASSEPILGRVAAVAALPVFWRFMVLMVIVLGVRAIWAYMSLLMPKYWLRVIGPDVQMGLLQTINPWIVLVGVVLMVPLANRFHVFWQLVVGASVSALSLGVLVLPWAWFGPDPASGYFRMAVVMAVVMSVGELLWSPKLSEFTAAIAPPGQEGAFYGLGMMPWFVAKLVVSGLSGHMLVRWCPEGIGTRIAAGGLPFWQSPEAMWLVLFGWALAGPLLATIFSPWLTKGADLAPRERRHA
ncbi:MAG: MFS transporter [Deltaproteobacteria bacterium]|nr:MFS transporter [Deltaproteobacteria bacterium]